MNTPVTFEIARLLKEKGFDTYCNKKYIAQCLWQKPDSREEYKNSEIHKNSSDVAAPTIAEVVMWFYTEHKIWISVQEYKDHAADVNDPYVFRSNYTKLKEFNTPEETYNAAIEYVLTKLI